MATCDKSIGGRIKELRERAEISQQELADSIGVSREKIAKIEGGEREAKAQDIIRMAEIFRTTTDWITKGIQPNNTEIHAATGLSDAAVEALQAFHGDDPTGLKTAALSKALSSTSFLNVLSSLLLVQSDERGYYEATCSPVDGFYTVEMSPDSFAASLGIRLLHTLEAIRTGNKAPLQAYPPAERRTAEAIEKLRSEGRLIDEQEKKEG
ncbi:MAG: helix-turn-helix transcriptional regulator [Clostridia bacterium]|nr:helix-turn-helix transcriptional regulator [Clostridia bacterium]MBR6185465.1 helix-turn-helix transcriptional regulator [Clostridia bacterium]